MNTVQRPFSQFFRSAKKCCEKGIRCERGPFAQESCEKGLFRNSGPSITRRPNIKKILFAKDSNLMRNERMELFFITRSIFSTINIFYNNVSAKEKTLGQKILPKNQMHIPVGRLKMSDLQFLVIFPVFIELSDFILLFKNLNTLGL